MPTPPEDERPVAPPLDPPLVATRLSAAMVDQAAAVLSAQERLQRLLAANRVIVSELSLPVVLRRIVDAARDVAQARYAALGVIGPDGALEQFLHSGMDAATVAAVGELPKGRGVLGALIADPQPIRLERIDQDPRSAGFPPGHPPMLSFLGVPIRTPSAVFGNLYLTDRTDGEPFSEEDEELVLALAATAGIAIENARLYEEARVRQEWLRASGEISRTLLADAFDDLEVLRRIASSVRRLATADVVSVVLPSAVPEQLDVVAAVGTGEAELAGLRYPRENTIAWRAMQENRGIRIDGEQRSEFYQHLRSVLPVTCTMALPLNGGSGPRGALVAGRVAGPFTDGDLDMAETFAGQAALALELADSRLDQQRLSLLEDRDRIAHDLHDHVIQRLFATGLSLQSIAGSVTSEGLSSRLELAVEALDETIRTIRSSIFALQDRRWLQSLRSTSLRVVEEVGQLLPARPDLSFSGPLDTVTDAGLLTDVEAVLRESLSNVVKHARARQVQVRVDTDDGQLSVSVTDDGTGLTGARRHSGLTNLRHRAEQRGGRLDLDHHPPGGLRLRWTVPLPTARPR